MTGTGTTIMIATMETTTIATTIRTTTTTD